MLDTLVPVWLDQDSAELGPRCRRLVDGALADDALTVSAISFWEVAMLVARKRLGLALTVDQWRRDLLSAGLRPWGLVAGKGRPAPCRRCPPGLSMAKARL